MAQNLAGADSILKEFYIAPIQEQLNNEVLALQLFSESAVTWDGSNKAVIPVHVSRNSGVGFRAEGDDLPTAGAQGYERLEILAKFMYGRFGFTGPALEFTETDKASFEPVMSGEMKRLATDVKNLLNKAMFDSGRVIGFIWQQKAEVGVAAWQYSGRPSNAVDTQWGVEVGGANTVDVIRLDTYATFAAGVAVSAITETAITLGALDTTATPDGTVFAVIHNNANRTREVTGLFGCLADPTYFTVARQDGSGNEILQSNFLLADFAAAAPVYNDLSLDAIQILMDKILLASDGEVDMMLMNPVHRQSYTTLLQGTAAGVPTAARLDVKDGKTKGDAGFTSIGYANIPFRTSQHAPKGTINFLTRANWEVLQRRPGDFAQADGKVLNKVQNKDAYEGFWKHYLNLVCVRPNAQGILTGCSFIGL